MSIIFRFAIAFLLLFASSVQVYAEGITKEQGDAILKELKAIRQELNQIKQKGLVPQGRARAKRHSTAKVSTLGNPF